MAHTTHAFTLIEVLVVIAVIGILAGLLIPNFLSARKRPYDAAALACGQAIVRTQTVRRAELGTFATTLTDLGPDATGACTDKGVTVTAQGVTPTPATAAGNMTVTATSVAFTVFHPRGNGAYRYATAGAAGERLDTLERW